MQAEMISMQEKFQEKMAQVEAVHANNTTNSQAEGQSSP